MSEILFYFTRGLDHILDINGIDHLLFIVSICVFFSLKEWRNILILITAFTIGHSITLALSVFDLIPVNARAIEILIPVTIIITCLNNLYKAFTGNKHSYKVLYIMVLLFGCIHGMGFSNFFKSMLFEGDSMVVPLLMFNLGIEIGQLCIITLFLFITYLLNLSIKKLTHKHIIIATSIVVLIIASQLLIEQLIQ